MKTTGRDDPRATVTHRPRGWWVSSLILRSFIGLFLSFFGMGVKLTTLRLTGKRCALSLVPSPICHLYHIFYSELVSINSVFLSSVRHASKLSHLRRESWKSQIYSQLVVTIQSSDPRLDRNPGQSRRNESLSCGICLKESEFILQFK